MVSVSSSTQDQETPAAAAAATRSPETQQPQPELTPARSALEVKAESLPLAAVCSRQRSEPDMFQFIP